MKAVLPWVESSVTDRKPVGSDDDLPYCILVDPIVKVSCISNYSIYRSLKNFFSKF